MQRVRGVFFPDSDTERVRDFYDFGDHEAAARETVLSHCRRFRRAIEVGAHVGLHTRELAKRFVAVEAFEPQPQVFSCLVENLSGLGVGLHQTALAEGRRPGFIAERPGRDSGKNLVELERAPRTVPCLVRPIDAYRWTDVDLIHVAVDRDAASILAGAADTLRRCRPVLWIDAASEQDFELDPELGQLGYRVVAGLTGGGVLSTEILGAASPTARRLLLDDGTGRRLVQIVPTREFVVGGDEIVVIGGRIRRTERIGFHADAGPGEALGVALGPDAGNSKSPRLVRKGVEASDPDAEITDTDGLLQKVGATFRDGAFRVSAPPELLALFRDLVVSLQRPTGDHVIARHDLRLAANLDDVVARPPLAMTDDHIKGLRLDFHGRDGRFRSIERPVCLDPAEFTAQLVTCYLNRGGGGNPVINAFASGIGAQLAYAEDGPRDGVAVVWGVLRNSKTVIDAVQARGGHFYYIDHAYFGRGHLLNYRITRNGFEAGPIRQCPPDRLNALGVELQPWKSGGRHILVCPPTDYFIEAHGAHSWLDDTLAALKTHTDREIVVRLKPQPGEATAPLPEAMAGAHAVVTHSSNVAVEAVVAGTPVFVSPTSAAAPMGLTNLARIEEPVRPDRMPWLAHLTYSQFSFDEVKYGTAWRLLREFEARPFV